MPRGANNPSILLSQEENEQVFSLIGPKCQSLATAVVQLFITDGPAHSEWRKKDTGILCLIKDNHRRSYFFRIYCLNRKAMIWEHEVYIQIEYKNPRPYLHTFEAEEYMTAFNFAHEEEAKTLRNILIEKMKLRKKKREERRQRSVQAAKTNSTAANRNSYSSSTLRYNGSHAPAHTPVPPPPAPILTPLKHSSGSNNARRKKNVPHRKITKQDIGMPQNFQHLSHIGPLAYKDVEADSFDEEAMQAFFSRAGISETQLQDQETLQFIYDFINSNGGLDAVKEDLYDTGKQNNTKVNTVSNRPPPPVPSRGVHPLPPGPPSRAPPPPPSRAVPPPPPPPGPAPAPQRNPPPPRPPQPPPQLTSTVPPSVPPPPPPSAPPPPPPAPPAPPAPEPEDAAVPPDARSALMESIRNGNKNLRRVEAPAKVSEAEPNRNNLLSEIRQGVELRSVSRTTTAAPTERRAEGCSLADALAREMEKRCYAIQASDSESDDESASDAEWDD